MIVVSIDGVVHQGSDDGVGPPSPPKILALSWVDYVSLMSENVNNSVRDQGIIGKTWLRATNLTVSRLIPIGFLILPG